MPKFTEKRLYTIMRRFINCVQHSSVFVKRVLYEKYGLYDVKYEANADYDFHLRLLKSEKPILLREDLGTRRLHGKSFTWTFEGILAIIKDSTKIRRLNK